MFNLSRLLPFWLPLVESCLATDLYITRMLLCLLLDPKDLVRLIIQTRCNGISRIFQVHNFSRVLSFSSLLDLTAKVRGIICEIGYKVKIQVCAVKIIIR